MKVFLYKKKQTKFTLFEGRFFLKPCHFSTNPFSGETVSLSIYLTVPDMVDDISEDKKLSCGV